MAFTDSELNELYERYAPVLYRRCLSILKDEALAQDAVHETFARVIDKADQFQHQSSPLTWMYRISTNYCLNQIRNRDTRRGKREDHAHDIAGDGIAPPTAAATLDHQRIRQLLEEVDEEVRAVVVHTYFDDCTRREVAELVGLSVPTVRKRLNTFLEHARRALGPVASLWAILPLLWSTP